MNERKMLYESMPPLVFLDCETTGLDPRRYGMIELGAVAPNGNTFTESCRPKNDAYDVLAMAVNGQSPEEVFARETTEKEVIAHFLEWCERHYIGTSELVQVGKNPDFDRRFLEDAWGQTLPMLSHRKIDLNGWVYLCGLQRGIDLNHPRMQSIVFKDLDLPQEQKPHTALRGAIYHRSLFEALKEALA